MFIGLMSASISIIGRSVNSNRIRLALIFTPIFIFLSLRYNYGNDYPGYLSLFNEIASLYEMNYDPELWRAEVGWLFLNRLFIDYGFFTMIAFTAFLNCVVYAKFILDTVPEKYYWLAIYIYICVPENLLVQASAMRQCLAILLFLFSFQFIVKKNIVKYCLVIALASLFHSSALLLFPVYFVVYLHSENTKRMIPLFMVIYFSLFFYSDMIISFLQDMLISDQFEVFERYSVYDDKGSFGSGFGILFFGFYLYLLLYYYSQQSENGKLTFKLAIISIYLIPLSIEVAMLIRVNFYFSVFSIAAIPLLAISIRSYPLRISFVFVYMAYIFYGFANFFENPIWKASFSEYKTVLNLIFY